MDEMTEQSGTPTTLELLAEYNERRNERDKAIEYIEKRAVSENSKPSYDDLFKENVKLRLQIQEQATEIESLVKVIEGLRNSKVRSGEILVTDDDGSEKNNARSEVNLPPRSADRNRNTKNLSIPIPNLAVSNEMSNHRVPQIDVRAEMSDESNRTEAAKKTTSIGNIISPSNSISGRPLNTPQAEASPATSVQYTTSRISITSPQSPRRSAVQTRIRSPQSANRVTAVVNNQVHSPLRSNDSADTLEAAHSPLLPESISKEDNKSPDKSRLGSKLQNSATDFSPGSKQNLNSFTEFLEDTFGEEGQESPLKNIKDFKDAKDAIKPPAPPSFASLSANKGSPNSLKLRSPVILTRRDNVNEHGMTQAVESRPPVGKDNSSDSKDGASSKELDAESFLTKSAGTAHASSSQGSTMLEVGRRHGGSVSSGKSSAFSFKNDVPLFVQPEEFGSIRIELLSTLYLEGDSATTQCKLLFSVVDRKTDKEMFKFSKNVAQLYEMDANVRPKLSFFALPNLPERAVFDSLIPTKVDNRRERINQYFYTIFSIPDFPATAGLQIAQFMSTDTVTNPMLLGDAVKEGSLLMRRAKALSSGPNWRVRYGVLSGEVLLLYDRGQLAERVRLRQSSIELLPNLPEDKYGTRNGFVIVEHKKNGLSSTTRYYLCSETSRERELWVSEISGLITNPLIPPSSSAGSISTVAENASSFSKAESSNGLDQVYVTDLTNDVNSFVADDNSNISPQDVDEPSDYDKENRRLKMRSFFPFKKLASNALSMVSDEGAAEESFESEAKFSDTSIAKSLESMNLNGTITNTSAVFGSSLTRCLELSSHLYQGKYQIPSVVYRCLEFLYKNHGIQEEGIFRLSGSSAVIKSLQEQFDREYDVDLCNYNNDMQNNGNASSGTFIDVNTVSGLLKLYLRKLPHSILGEDNFISFKNIVDSNHQNPSQIAIKFRNLINSGAVPQANVSLMYALFELLVRIEEKNFYNKMNLRNLCIVFSPTLNIPVTILQPLIIDFNCIFKGESPIELNEREHLDLNIPQL
ncbi:hypothetical protein HG536_0A07050 [Torulaspora globosa]|uniref:Rho-GAP domain-containing protein n=1 Tax=Torulaspora globosa TaxID=48254 RepID=A0A7G3ZBK4_9SACH|nr:uncharacterized protein HG536_0A07050 [Torulaspora globosa]QLL30890.1 hypothetical protein HG536_0A07050 [Torulaspora globosa]